MYFVWLGCTNVKPIELTRAHTPCFSFHLKWCIGLWKLNYPLMQPSIGAIRTRLLNCIGFIAITSLLSSKSVVLYYTQGAGDAFIGALAYFLAYLPELPLREKLRRACAVATDSVTRPGAWNSFPTREQLPQELFSLTWSRFYTALISKALSCLLIQ